MLRLCFATATAVSLVGAAQYDQAVSTHFVKLNKAVGVSDVTSLSAWNCGTSCEALPEIKDVKLLRSPMDGTLGIAAEHRGDCVLVFRGTKNPENVVSDINILQVSPYASCPDCKVHQGFLEAWHSLKDEALSALRNLGCAQTASGSSSGTRKEIKITGHSLGGAIAALAAWDLVSSGHKVSQVYTYGQPRTGNWAWASTFEDLMKRSKTAFYRVVHYKDPVPHLPSILFNYRHTGPEVYYYTWESGPYQICKNGEDYSCSGRLSLLETMPFGCLHCSYLGMNPCSPKFTGPECNPRRLQSEVHV
eukprot:TRINITY_DN9321_c0_g1_i1.p1 TRINITY_DN9321_c0_g1~~TRINITY_DN9321_c0_g1_i1.p1  ORF type:complete len:305 (-),score=49.85 TRINITY_DN9321_c0_g1_i1:208-1122(-)